MLCIPLGGPWGTVAGPRFNERGQLIWSLVETSVQKNNISCLNRNCTNKYLFACVSCAALYAYARPLPRTWFPIWVLSWALTPCNMALESPAMKYSVLCPHVLITCETSSYICSRNSLLRVVGKAYMLATHGFPYPLHFAQMKLLLHGLTSMRADLMDLWTNKATPAYSLPLPSGLDAKNHS